MATSSTAKYTNITVETDASDVQRVVAYPLDIAPATAIPPGEKHFGFDAKQLRLQYFYTGTVLCADSSSGENSSNSGFVPHGKGKMACVLYAKPTTAASNHIKSTLLPYPVLVESYGEVNDLRNVPLLSLAVYSGEFAHGQRHGRGKLTVCKKYAITCGWDSDTPLLDGTLCLLQLFHSSAVENPPRLAGQYTGMVTFLSSSANSKHGRFAGLAWAHQAEFVADGVGEMYALRGMQRCGNWQRGQRHGFGVEFDPAVGTVYMGNFAYDHRDGPGALHYCATGAQLCGNWKDGKLMATGNLVFPSWPFTLQGALWKSYETYSFEYGTFVRSGGSLSGVWEPLFVDFDEFLATSVVDLQQQEQSCHAGSQGNCDETAKADARRKAEVQDNKIKTDDATEETSDFFTLFTSMMQRSDFTAVLAAFQRFYYFLYKPCLGAVCKESQDTAADLGIAGMSPIAQELMAIPVSTVGWTPPSWCEEMCRANLSPLCPHDKTLSESLATRMPPTKLFERAMHDLASFVSSVRLRLISYAVAHPAACGVSVSKSLIAACWDAVFALVAPVVHELAAAADTEAATETCLALSRCGELRAKDFVPMDSVRMKKDSMGRFFPGPRWSVTGVCDSGASEESIAWPFAAPARHTRRGISITSNGPLLSFSDPTGAAYPSLAETLSLFHAMWREARGLFPTHPLQQERWMCVRLLDAFSGRTEESIGEASAVLNPVAVLRVLRILTCGVNLPYPFPLDEKKIRTDPFRGDTAGAEEEEEEEEEEEKESGEGEKEKDEEKLLAIVLDAADAALSRLRHIYPSIRRCECDAARVYPLDELAMRARFILLAASGSIHLDTPDLPRALHQTVAVMQAAVREQRGVNGRDEDGSPVRSVLDIVLWAAECVGGAMDFVSEPQETTGGGPWSLFLPNITTTSEMPRSRTVSEDTAPDIMDHSGEETLRLSLLQQFLAELGICFELRVRLCYDNEEDALESLVPARCVGREATLSLKVPDGFIGGLACEVLADAWLHTMLSLRTTTPRRRTTRTDLPRSSSTE